MALSIGVDQLAVHQCSKALVQDQLSQYSWMKKSEWRPPEFAAATCKDEEPVIPSPTVFDGLGREFEQDHNGLKASTDNEDLFPSVAECAVHLQLLDSFLMLREKVLKSNALDCAFSIRPVVRYETTGYGRRRRRTKKPDNTFKTRREKKWLLFVKLAVSRFFMWCGEIENKAGNDVGEDVQWFRELPPPPLDVLMVWHSLMLNPKLYKSFCAEGNFKRLPEIDMPWAAIHKAISPKDSSYAHPQSNLPEESGINNDLLQYLTDFTKFPPSIIEILSKWANTDNLTSTELTPLLTSEPPLPPSQASLLQAYQLALSPPSTLPHLSPLSDALHRQHAFTTKMHQHAWLRSPALPSTLRRALARYAQYLTLFARFPNRLLVPTLDIDLAWHTHLCAPRRYARAIGDRAGRFVNHDDTVGGGVLAEGLEMTRGLYRVVCGREYLRCLCWDCEALRDALERCGEGEGEGGDGVDYGAVAVDVAYHRAVEIARRTSKPFLPARLK